MRTFRAMAPMRWVRTNPSDSRPPDRARRYTRPVRNWRAGEISPVAGGANRPSAGPRLIGSGPARAPPRSRSQVSRSASGDDAPGGRVTRECRARRWLVPCALGHWVTSHPPHSVRAVRAIASVRRHGLPPADVRRYSMGSARGRAPRGKASLIRSISASVRRRSPAPPFSAVCSGVADLGIAKIDCRCTRNRRATWRGVAP